MQTKGPSPNRFAAAVAKRLDEIVPPGFAVRSRGSSVDVYAGSDDRHASAGASIITSEDGRSLTELLEAAAWGILNGAQDGVMEMLREQWPLDRDRRAAEPAARIDGDRLLMWFGDERAPVVALRPIHIGELLEGAA